MSKEQGSHPRNAHAEKRALWEVRQRYNIKKKAAPRHRSAIAAPPASPPRSRRPASPRPRRHSPRWLARIIGIVVVIGLVSGGIFGYKVLSAGNKISVSDKSLLGQLSDLLFRSGDELKGEKDDRINILLMAVGGEGHSGENLADTIMVASLRPSDQTVALVSIPRDLYVQVPNEQFYSKLNAVHAYGEAKKRNNGPELMRQKVEEITGVPIHYYGRIDFIAFKSIVDALGGVNINIAQSFDDYWHKISFPAGTEKMNGERALAYARARYVEGSEGGDFKRAARQQQLLLAIQEKAFSVNTALDFSALNQIMDSLANNIRTDLQLWEMKRLYEIARQIGDHQVHSVVLTTGHKGVLVGGTEILGGVPASILRPRTGDYSEIQSITNSIFTETSLTEAAQAQTSTPSATPTPTPSPSPTPNKDISIEIRNGTAINGLAKKTADQLTGAGYKVGAIGNAATTTQKNTTVYAVKEAAAENIEAITALLKAESGQTLPADEKAGTGDILIILGADAE